MRQRFYWLAIICVSIATVPVSYGYDYYGDRKLKNIALEYGDTLTSVENGENWIRLDGVRNQRLSYIAASTLSTTRCTTGGTITLDPTYNPSSDEKEKESTITADQEITETQTEMQETEVTKVPEKQYKPPPEAKKPDHYIDDP